MACAIDRMKIEVRNFVDCPESIPFVGEQIFNQWFASKPGHTLEGMIARMRGGKADKVPIGLIAFVDGEPAGTVSLLEEDLQEYKHCRPWLAGLLVFPEFRNRGVAGALIESVHQAVQLAGEREAFLYTSIPALYEKFGWKTYGTIESEPDAVVMRWEPQA